MKCLLGFYVIGLHLIGSFLLCALPESSLQQTLQGNSLFIDQAHVFHEDEKKSIKEQLISLEKETGVVTHIQVMPSTDYYSQAIDRWFQSSHARKEASLVLLALVNYNFTSPHPEVVLRAKGGRDDLDTQEIEKILRRLEKKASLSTNPKTSIEILVPQIKEEVLFLLKRVDHKKNTNKINDQEKKKQLRKKKKRWLVVGMFLFFTTLFLSALYWFKQRRKVFIFPEPHWHSRLGAPYSGGSNSLVESSSSRTQ